MLRLAFTLLAVAGAALAAPVIAQGIPASTVGVRADPLPRLTVDQALAAERQPLARRVLQLIETMESTVVEGKQPGFGEANWNGLASFVDTAKFRRVGNFNEVVDWKDYVGLLTSWARSSWYTGRIRRINQVGNLVYIETEERSSTKGPFGDDGGYQALNSNAVYGFDAKGKLTDLWVYDQMSRPVAK